MQTTTISAASGLGLAAFLLGLAGAPVAQAQSYSLSTLASFSGTGNPNGGLTLSADGSTLYGTTESGLVYSLPVSGGTPATLAEVGGTANAGLTLSADGRTLYGTTIGGGVNTDGDVFSVPTSGGAATILTSFNGTDGAAPESILLSADGSTLYGITPIGGASNLGTVFSLPVSGGTPTTLTSFSGTNGNGIGTGLTRIGSTLYGTTNGGANNRGEIFSLPTSGGTPTVLSTFNGQNGSTPVGLTLSADGRTFYGTADSGTANGEVFSAPVAGGAPTVLYGTTFGPHLNSVTLVGNTLYGTGSTSGSRSDQGGVLSLPVSGGNPTVLATFNGDNGSSPAGGLTLGANGTFYGATYFGGAFGDGTVFSLTPSGSVPVPEASSLVSFGLLLLGGFGGLILRARRKSAAGWASQG